LRGILTFIGQININSAFVEYGNTRLSIIVALSYYCNKLRLISLRIDPRRYNLCLRTDSLASVVGLIPIFTVTNNGDFLNFRIRYNSFHESEGVLTLLQIPFVEYDVHPITTKRCSEFQNPSLMLRGTPAVGYE